MPDPSIYLSKVWAAVFAYAVDNKPFYESLKEFGITEEEFKKSTVAPQSSEGAAEYFNEIMEKDLKAVEREDGEDLYVVKKAYCFSSDFEDTAKAIEDGDKEKFKMIKVIASDRNAIAYKGKNQGIEVYMVTAKSNGEALRKTTDMRPQLWFETNYLNEDDARKFDSLLYHALCDHTPRSFERIFEFIAN